MPFYARVYLMKPFPTTLSLALTLLVAPAQAEISTQQRAQLDEVSKLVKQAGTLFVEQKYEQSAQAIADGLVIAKRLIATKDQQVLDALEPDYNRMKKAYGLLRAKGISLPEASAQTTTPPSLEQSTDSGVSFTKEIVPIVMAKCGRCHVQEAKGRYSAQNFASLVKGSRKGKAVVPGKPESSRLLMLIKTGKMPPKSRGFPPEQIQLIEEWIAQGAQFDGHDEKANLRSLKPATGA